MAQQAIPTYHPGGMIIIMDALLKSTEKPLDGHTVVSWTLAPEITGDGMLNISSLPKDSQEIVLGRLDKFSTTEEALVSHDKKAKSVPELAASLTRQGLVAEHDSAFRNVINFLLGRSFRVDESEVLQFDVPLFVLSAADTAGCTATYKGTTRQDAQLSWSATIVGSGLGGEGRIEVSTSEQLNAKAGETKLVFVRAWVTVDKVTELRNGAPTKNIDYRIDYSTLKATKPALRLLPKEAVPAGAGAQPVDSYPLASDSPDSISLYEYTWSRQANISPQLGLKFKGVEIGAKLTVEREISLNLEYGLSGGYNYELWPAAYCDGLVWRRT